MSRPPRHLGRLEAEARALRATADAEAAAAKAKREAAARAVADAAAAQAAAAEEETRLETSRRRLETSLALREETKRRNGALARWQVERAARAIGARHRGLASPCRPTPPCLGVRSSGGRGRGRGGAARAAGAAGGLCGVAGWPACACQRAHAAPALSTPSSGPLSLLARSRAQRLPRGTRRPSPRRTRAGRVSNRRARLARPGRSRDVASVRGQ